MWRSAGCARATIMKISGCLSQRRCQWTDFKIQNRQTFLARTTVDWFDPLPCVGHSLTAYAAIQEAKRREGWKKARRMGLPNNKKANDGVIQNGDTKLDVEDSSNSVASGGTASQTVVENTVDSKRRKRLIFWLVVSGLLSIVLLGGVAIAVIFLTHTSTSSLSQRQQELEDVVDSVLDPAALVDATSPQAKAKEWLLHMDNLWSDDNTIITEEMVLQRFVLAVVYFAMNGPSSSTLKASWLVGSECGNAWTGVTCDANGTVHSLVLGTWNELRESTRH